uniref:NADH-ubiquinone oxidoreductase chain 2 n=1 Tax=Montfortula punctata TaxID=1906930 RepID=A0A1J0CYH3_9VEST|nr:NADH dehydrogenase subunit 2 [Montfortula punctata]
MPYLLFSDFLFVGVMVLGVIISLSSVSWLLIWVGMEISLIGFVPVISGNGVFGWKSTESSESLMKYFVVQAIGSGLILLGGFSVFSMSKVWDIGIGEKSIEYMLYIGPFFSVIGLSIKLGVFPFHFWVPSVMAGMSWFSCLLLTTLQKIVPLFFLCVFLGFVSSEMLLTYLLISSVASSVIGGFGGINQTSLRGVMAYSSIGHMGWLLMSTIIGSSVMCTYLLFYVFMSFGFFFILWKLGCDSVGKLNGCLIDMSTIERVFVVGILLSYMGMPPFFGFSVKWYSMISFFELCNFGIFTYFYFFLMFLGSLLSVSYYLMIFISLMVGSSGVYVKKMKLMGMLEESVLFVLGFIFFVSLLGGIELMMGGSF